MDTYRSMFTGNPGQSLTATRNVNRNNLVSGVGADQWPLLFRERSRLSPGTFPDAPVYPITSATYSDTSSMIVFDPNIRTPYAQSWTFGLQRELGKSMALEVRYVGHQKPPGMDHIQLQRYRTQHARERSHGRVLPGDVEPAGQCREREGLLRLQVPGAEYRHLSAADQPCLVQRVVRCRCDESVEVLGLELDQQHQSRLSQPGQSQPDIFCGNPVQRCHQARQWLEGRDAGQFLYNQSQPARRRHRPGQRRVYEIRLAGR